MNATGETLFGRTVYALFFQDDLEVLHEFGGSINCELASKILPDLLHCRMPSLHILRVKQ